jgi:hypothetical protein
MNRAGALPTLLAAGSFAAPTEASAEIAPFSANDLYSSCLAYRDDPAGGSGHACVAYLRGFLDGTRTAGTVAEPSSQREPFRERALRTRTGSRHPRQPLYCLGASVSLDQLVNELLTHPVPEAESTPASAAIYRSLRRLDDCRRR